MLRPQLSVSAGIQPGIDMALGAEDYETWFVRHLVDPRPVLQDLALVA
jgi:hypothetical protein